MARGDHVIAQATEHPSVLAVLEALGVRVTILSVDRAGLVDPDALSKAITDRTVLASFMGTTGAAMLQHLKDNRHIYDEMMAKGNVLRDGFNEHCESMGYPFCMTGIGSLFQIHAKAELPKVPRDLQGQDQEALSELQLHFRLNNILLPWMHLAFFGASHTQADLDEMLRVFKVSVDAVMSDKTEVNAKVA